MLLFDFHHHHPEKSEGIYNLNFGEQMPNHYFSVGIHPENVSENLDERFEWTEKFIQHPNCVAVGECGLDARFPTDKLQRDVFHKHIEWSNHYQKPLIIHCVKRFSEIIPFISKANYGVVIHGFNKKKSIGDSLLAHGCRLSFGKSLLYDVNLQYYFKSIPLDSFLLETDASDFNLQKLYWKAAELRKMKIEELEVQLKNNLRSLNILL